MVKGSPTVQIPKSGCPHGLPHSACPVCSGGGSSGGASTKRKANEMSWNECYSIGQQMKAQKLHKQEMEKALNEVLIASRLADIQEIAMAEKFALSVILTNSPIIKGLRALAEVLPQPVQKVLNAVAKPIKAVLEAFDKIAEKITEKIQEKIADISDKLAAIYGEQKNAITRFLEEKFGKKKPNLNPFGLIDTEMEQGEEEEEKEESEKLLSKIKKGLFSFFTDSGDLVNE